MKNYFIYSLFVISLGLILSCNPRNKNADRPPDELVTHIDSSMNPGDDFFLYANGRWFNEHPIPASEQQNGLWQMIQDTINAQVLKICRTSSEMTFVERGSNKQKIGDFYFSGMDSIAINRAGLSGLEPDLHRIDSVHDIKDILRIAAFLHASGSAPLFRFGVGQDDKISSKMAIFISQGGLSLPDRSYYTDTDHRTVLIRQSFMKHLEKILAITGYDVATAQNAAQQFMKLETAIAKSSRKREDTRDPWKNYNKISYGRLTELTPDIDWEGFMKEFGLEKADTVIVGQPEFLTALNGYLKSFPLSTWKVYLKYHLVHDLSAYLDDTTYKEVFNFYARTLRGIEEPRPRWKRVVTQTDHSLGDLVGQVYVEEFLPHGTREKLLEIGNAIKTEYAERIKNLDWMSEVTKVKALKKLNTVVMKLGNPEHWKDMSALSVDRSSYVNNVMRANRWYFSYMVSKYGKPVNRAEWDMEPQTYNAYYSTSNNEIVVPGCNILIPGYEYKMPDDALLYSIVGGSTFGHEIIHGFDDQGGKYDDAGNLNNWWTAEDSIKFYEKTRMIVKQFNNYIAVDSLHINGENTQGENIADLGGLTMAYNAFKRTPQFKNHEIIGGLNPDQRFFLGYALAWMINQRPEAMALQVKSDEHSPAIFRVNGPLSNIPEFYTAFNIKEGDPMWRPDSLRIRIW